jgi:hypothetical protein
VPRPPILITPKRQNGVESVVIVLGTTSRMTMTFDGSDGTSLEDMMKSRDLVEKASEGKKEGFQMCCL